ncbi:MAG: hypothetical protein RSC12_03525 [Alistipes sp.]
MKLTIDSLPCDIGTNQPFTLGYDAAARSDVESGRAGRTVVLTLPVSKNNEALFAFAGDPHAHKRFNDTLHFAEITAEDISLFTGVVRLLETSAVNYRIEIRGGASQWAKNAAREMFNRIPINYSARLTPTEICNSWTNDSPVKFFPIRRDTYEQQNSSSDLLPAERMLSVDDYHPFLHVGTLLKVLFEQAGYTINSRFLESALFRSLYMSGAYPSHNTEAACRKMAFFARRTTTVTAHADNVGRVYATPFGAYNIVGNIVETATPQSIDEDGMVWSDLFNNGNCFGIDSGKILFRPPTTVHVSFEYYLKYTTDHRILTRERLKGFDSVNLGTGSNMPFRLANRYIDHRNAPVANFQYRALVFSHTPGAQYRLTYTMNGLSGVLWSEFATRSTLVTTPASGTCTDPTLQIKSGNSWIPYSGDWALYDGYVGETGQTTVELRVKTAPEIVEQTSPKRFNTIYFYGADEGMQFTLHKSCSLRPLFSSAPGYGSQISFADVAQHAIRQSQFLDAVRHLFNLQFHTDERSKTVYIEPCDDFYTPSQVVDWSGKIDLREPIEMADLALGIHESRTFGYQEGDGTVSRLNATLATPFGEWQTRTDSFAAIAGDEKQINPLFCPSLTATNCFSNAPAAHILQVCDRDNADTSDSENFVPRIVRYCGLHPLPADQRWGYPSGKAEYPLAAFHFTGDSTVAGFTLCFEDRDSMTGLHRYYDRQITQESTRQRITLSLRLEPQDLENLFTIGGMVPDIRAIFLLDIAGETIRCTLHTIEGYDPAKPSTRCTFTRLSNH